MVADSCEPTSWVSIHRPATCKRPPACVLRLERVPMDRSLNEYILEPEKVAVEPVTANFGDGVKTYYIRVSHKF